jgi:hypothetical protein
VDLGMNLPEARMNTFIWESLSEIRLSGSQYGMASEDIGKQKSHALY